MIEARIVIADDKWGRQLGARFGTQSAFGSGNRNYGVSGTLTDTVAPLVEQPAVARIGEPHEPGRPRRPSTAARRASIPPAASPSSST